MKIRAVVFDMDGVLIDATDWHFEAFNRALGLFGMEIDREDHLNVYNGLPTRAKLEILSEERGLPRSLHPFLNEMKQRYTVELIHSRCKPSFTHRYALSRLVKAGYVLGVASNSIRGTVELMMDKAELTRYLSVVVAASDVAQGKPDPAIYLAAIDRLGFEASEVLVIEDNNHGVLAAEAAGCHVLLVRDPGDVSLDNLSWAIEQCEKAESASIIRIQKKLGLS